MRDLWRSLIGTICLILCGPVPARGFAIIAGPSVTSSGRTATAIFADLFGDSPVDGHIHLNRLAPSAGLPRAIRARVA